GTATDIFFDTPGKYMVAFTHGEGTGGSHTNWLFNAPQGPGALGLHSIKPATELGRWEGLDLIAENPLNVSADLFVAGDSTLNYNGSSAYFAFMGVEDGATVNLNGPATVIDEFIVDGEATIAPENDVTIVVWSDEGNPTTLNKMGAGTLILDDTLDPGWDAGNNMAAATTFRVMEGSFNPKNQEALGSAAGAVASIVLDGGTFAPEGVTLTSYSPGLLVGTLPGNNLATTPNPGNFGIDPLGTSAAELSNDPGIAPWAPNTQVVWTGEVYFDAAGVISFRENVDDQALLTIDGNEIFRNGTWNDPTAATVSKPEGWYPFELRMANGGGGAGRVGAVGFGFTRTDTGGDETEGLYAPAQNSDALTMDLFRLAEYDILAFDWSDTDLTVVSDSTLNAVTDHSAMLGTVTFNGGMLTTTGAPEGISLAGTVLAGDGSSSIGYNAMTTTNPGVIDDLGVAQTIVKTGPADVLVDQSAVLGSDSTIRVKEGTFGAINTLGAATIHVGSDVADNQSTVELDLSAGEDMTFTNNLVFDGGINQMVTTDTTFDNLDFVDPTKSYYLNNEIAEEIFNGLSGNQPRYLELGDPNQPDNFLDNKSLLAATGFLDRPLDGFDFTGHNGADEDHVGALWTGTLVVAPGSELMPGLIAVAESADDDGAWYIDVDNDGFTPSDRIAGASGTRNVQTGTVMLAAGEYPFALAFDEGTGGDWFNAKIGGPSVLSRVNDTLLTIGGQTDLAGEPMATITVDGTLDVHGELNTEIAAMLGEDPSASGALLIDIKPNNALAVTDQITGDPGTTITVQGGPLTAGSNIDADELIFRNGASLALGGDTLNVDRRLELSGTGTNLDMTGKTLGT
ncbi:MAG TPA: hypothetical protein VE890_03685, partial [Thermoguttaceae bacterium]|nr:hypothetical protein [Thermoguttaceae bacterium]